MKSSEIEIGACYLAKVGGRVVPVRVWAVTAERRRNGYFPVWFCLTNDLIPREIKVRSSQRFRARVEEAKT